MAFAFCRSSPSRRCVARRRSFCRWLDVFVLPEVDDLLDALLLTVPTDEWDFTSDPVQLPMYSRAFLKLRHFAQ